MSESSPRIVGPDYEGQYEVAWDRSEEVALLHEFVQKSAGKPRIIFLYGGDEAAYKNVLSGLSDSLNTEPYARRSAWGVPELLPAALFSCHLERTRRALPSIAFEILKSTTGASVYGYCNNHSMKLASGFVHRQRRAGAPVSLRSVLNREGIRPEFESGVLDQLLDANACAGKLPASEYYKLLKIDAQRSTEFSKSIDEKIIPMVSYQPSNVARFLGTTIRWDYSPIIFIQHYYRTHSAPQGIDSDRAITINLSSITGVEALEIMAPLIRRCGIDPHSELAINIMQGSVYARSRNLDEMTFTEGTLERVVDAFVKSAQPLDRAIEPQSAPLDAQVEGDVLALAGKQQPHTNTPIASLDALREEHLADVGRLADSLAGANTGPGFSIRLERVRHYLEMPLTQASSLLLANHVRALEDMFPAVRDLLTDVTAADVGASISGLGLFIRQFPAWRSFLEEADTKPAISEEALASLVSVGEAITQQPNSIVRDELKDGLVGIKDAAIGQDDNVLKFGFLRSVSNVYRAIGRYLRDRSVGVHKSFAAAFDKGVGELLADTALGAIVIGASGALVELATGFPQEFGWVLGLVAALSLRRRH